MFKSHNPLFLFILSLLFSSLSLQVSAQYKIPVSGIVISLDKSEPVDGAAISWNYKGVGSITNSDGKFVILLSPPFNNQDSLIFSCIGYKPTAIGIKDAVSNPNLTIRLQAAIENLKEVTIRPLTIKQLLDSINRHNYNAFVSPMKLSGYYREFVYTNLKCNEYADALCQYYFNNGKDSETQLKINASRCITGKKNNGDAKNAEFYWDSEVNPVLAFKYALLSEMIKKYFPDKALPGYKYEIAQAAESSDDLKITISPKDSTGVAIYDLVFLLTGDFTLKAYHLEIPDSILLHMKEQSLLGVHVKNGKLIINVKYASFNGRIYPAYYSIIRGEHVYGKVMSTRFDQVDENKSEFVVSELGKTDDLQPFVRDEL